MFNAVGILHQAITRTSMKQLDLLQRPLAAQWRSSASLSLRPTTSPSPGSTDGSFGMPEAGVGLPPEGGGSHRQGATLTSTRQQRWLQRLGKCP